MQMASADISAAAKSSAESGTAFRAINGHVQSVQKQMQLISKAAEEMEPVGATMEQSMNAAQLTAQSNRRASDEIDALNRQMTLSLDKLSAVVEQNTITAAKMVDESLEVSQAIETIASVSQENSAAVEEVSAAAAETNSQAEDVAEAARSLAAMAARLQQAIARFNAVEIPQENEITFIESPPVRPEAQSIRLPESKREALEKL
jgi:methyl-accepting chemotaxis protein